MVGRLDFMAYRSLYVIYRQIHFYAKSQFYFKQSSLAWVLSLIFKKILFQAIQLIQTVLIQLIQFSISTDFVHTQLNVKTVRYQTTQFSVSTVSMSKIIPF